ncbi:MAG TPA: HAD family acid phosphatase [Vicinamibacterales bacterium]|nr:HAD family acid phosphatase [Vicinamibacterales bacterium]
MTMASRTAIVGLILFAVSCAPTAQRAVPAPPVAERATLPGAIRWVRASAEHRALFLQVFDAASDRVRELAAKRERGAWAVILDADETVLDNSEYQRRRASQGLGFTPETWDAWVREEKATALPGAAAFLMIVHELGGRIAIVTNRDDYVCDETRRNMKALELAHDVVLCRVKGVSDKNPRFEAVQRGTAAPGMGPLEVVVWVGDNIQDFPALTQEVRSRNAEAFSAFGRSYFMLPNPMYGSWERLPVPSASTVLADVEQDRPTVRAATAY